ncbi:MAG: WecB/TagA/CpsF family glycosyltransferase [Clostridia bacterium]|nr:WecB/TagA/CpsF family glycosyltransferase [Clostridia bacterium]
MIKYFEKTYKNSANSFYNLVKENIINNNKMFIVTANPETLMIAEKNNEFKKALLDMQTTIIPDGIGIVKGARFLGYTMQETIPGVELCSKLFEYCNEFKKSIYFLGAKEEIVSKLINVINTNYPNAIISGYENGYSQDKQASFNKIIVSEPDVVLVALGIPEQELLIYNNLNKFNKGIFVGVGGSFDVLSGVKKRAPKTFRKLHLEWLYRIIKEPKRFKRFFNSNIKYLLKLKK